MAHSKTTSLLCDRSGIAALEVAIIAPIVLILLLGAMEYGWYFVKNEVVTRAVSNISDSIQRNPSDGTLQTLAANSGLNVINFNQSPNFICAQSFANLADAANANNASGVCSSGWNTGAPASGNEDNGTPYKAGDPYYVGVKAYVAYKALTPVMQFVNSYTSSNSAHTGGTNTSTQTQVTLLPGIQSSNIFKVTAGPTTSAVPSCAAGVSIVSNGAGGLVCGASGAPQCRMVYVVGSQSSSFGITNTSNYAAAGGNAFNGEVHGNVPQMYENGVPILTGTSVPYTDACAASEYLLGPTGAPIAGTLTYSGNGATSGTYSGHVGGASETSASGQLFTPFLCCKLPGY